MPTAVTLPKIVVICGPTAVGKTAFAIDLAEAFNGEIVGADSMQIYRFMNIGTAKPTRGERARIPHHMIDIVEPDEPFDAERFAERAGMAIAGILDKDKLPVVAGGTGLYIKALIHGLFRTPGVDARIRERLKSEALKAGPATLHARLVRCDPEAAGRIDPNDAHRICRALEVFEMTGRPISEFHRLHRFADDRFDALKIGLRMERSALYERIDRRVEQMIRAGFREEVRRLMEMGYATELKSMQSIGYRHMASYLRERIAWDDAVRTLKRDTRRFAKRQMTWFGADKRIHWLAPDRMAAARSLVEDFIRTGKPGTG